MLNSITIYNYRNISQAKLNFQDNVNILIEKNGYGKTNFLEAIYYVIFRQTFRPINNFAELIGPQDKVSKIILNWDNDILEFELSAQGKVSSKVRLNGKTLSKSQLIEKFPIILFAPHSVDLTSGEPSIRRMDLDAYLSIKDSKYLEHLKRYNTILKNRNALIKAIRDGKSTIKELDYWTNNLVLNAVYIYETRRDFFTKIKSIINKVSEDIYHDVFNLEVLYKPNIQVDDSDAKDTFLRKYIENQDKEIIVGKTLYGVHKDDYTFMYQVKEDQFLELKYHGSRGQQRIGSFIFKIAQFEILGAEKKAKSIFLFDDLMSELDDTHRNNLAKFILKQKNQLLLTGADEKEIPSTLKKDAYLFRLY